MADNRENTNDEPKQKPKGPRSGKRRTVRYIVIGIVVTLVLSAFMAGVAVGNLYGMATTFREEEHDILINLPDVSKRGTALSTAMKLIVVNVRSADRNEEDPLYVVGGQGVNLLQLREIVAAGVKNNADQKVLIRGDNHAFWGDGARALAACRAAGVTKANVGFDYDPIE